MVGTETTRLDRKEGRCFCQLRQWLYCIVPSTMHLKADGVKPFRYNSYQYALGPTPIQPLLIVSTIANRLLVAHVGHDRRQTFGGKRAKAALQLTQFINGFCSSHLRDGLFAKAIIFGTATRTCHFAGRDRPRSIFMEPMRRLIMCRCLRCLIRRAGFS